MGRNKIDIQYIKDDRIRNITFNKRKNGLLKKACELAVLCNIKMLLCFTDLSGNVYQFTSSDNIEMELIQSIHKKIFTKQDYPGFQKKKDSDSFSEAGSEQSIQQKKTRAQDQLQQQHIFLQQQLLQQHQQCQYNQTPQQMKLRNKIIDHIEKPQSQEPRKVVKIETKQEEQEIQKNKLGAKIKKNNDDLVFNDLIDHQQRRNFDDIYQCGNNLDENSNSQQQDQQDYKQQMSLFTSSNQIKLMKMDSLIQGHNNSKQNNYISEQYSKLFNKVDSLNNSKILQPSVQFIVPPQVYFNMNPSPINQSINKVFVGIDEPLDCNLGQAQYADGFKKYTK